MKDVSCFKGFVDRQTDIGDYRVAFTAENLNLIDILK